MNKTLVGVVVAVIVIGGGYYYWQGSKTGGFDPSKPYAISGEMGGATSTSGAVNAAPQSAAGELSLKDLLSSSKAQKCTIKVGTVGAGVDGTVLVSSGKVRGDFSSDSAVGKVGTHMIVRDGSAYSWVDGLKAGLKAPVSTSGSGAVTGGVNLEAKFNYQCEPWKVDNSVFTLPSDITFKTN